MAKYRVAYKEISYGAVILDLPDDATEAQIYEAADQAYFDGKIDWYGGDYEATGYEKED